MNREETIFEQALGIGAGPAREEFLRGACPDDDAMFERLRGLLDVHDRVGKFMEHARGAEGEPTVAVATAQIVLPLAEKPGDRIGRYRLLQKIGEGGCGVVYMAEQEEPVRRRVALKLIKPGMDTRQVIARFEAERQALALMDHPNIAKVFDAGATGQRSEVGGQRSETAPVAPLTSDLCLQPSGSSRPYFVMELVRGVKITDYCDEKKLTTQERLELFMQICRAVQHAHQKGIIHRDLKPSNILVSVNDGVAVPKVIDFGIAKATTGAPLTDKTVFTAFEQFIGTPAYMSPEQALVTSLDIDTRTDIYSLGVLLYELLTGKTPFDPKELLKAGLDEMRRAIRETEPVRPSTRLSTLPCEELSTTAQRRGLDAPKLISELRGDLDWIVLKCLEKDRARRYETANGLASDIQRHLNNEPVVACPPSKLYRFQKLVRRNKPAFAVAGIVLLALWLGLAVSIGSLLKERQARQRAVDAEQKATTAATKSQAVAQFLKDMLQGVGPSVARGRDTKLLQEILEKTAKRVTNDLHEQPDVEGELLNVIGEVYAALGQYKKAEERFRAALALRTQLFSDEHLAVASSLENLAAVLMDQDQFADAETALQKVLAMRRKLLGEEHRDVATTLNWLGQVYWLQGKSVEAEAAHLKALAMRRKLLGDEHPSVAESLNNLGNVLLAQGRLAEAESTHRQALTLRRKILSNDDLDLTASLINLASALWRRGTLDQAEALQREAITNQTRLFDGDHPDLAVSLENLATILWHQGRQTEAEPLFRRALEMRQKLLGQEHHLVAFTLNNLAVVLWTQGKLAEAENFNRQALAMRLKLLGPDHGDVALSYNSLALILRDLRQLPKAEQAAREALRIRRKTLSPEDPNLASSLDNLALVLRDEGKYVEAEGSTRECLDIRGKQMPDDWITFNTRSRLGADLLGQNKYADAEALLLSGYEGMKQREDKIPRDKMVRIREALERLVALYETWDKVAPNTGKADQGAGWREKIEAFDAVRNVTQPKAN